MKLTTKVVGTLVVIVVVIVVVHMIIQHFTAPKDTPIVMGGGSIYGNTSPQDTDGWKAASSLSQYGSLHASSGGNPKGIDNLTFTLFDSSPTTNPETGTRGWAILVRNPLPGGGPNPTPAVSFCSDSGCSAAHQPCAAFDKHSPVYFTVRAGAQLTAPPGSGPSGATMRVNFHDTTPACNSPVANACDKIYDVALITCNGGADPVFTTTCNQNPSQCNVQVGH
jgi:hypothetical protein